MLVLVSIRFNQKLFCLPVVQVHPQSEDGVFDPWLEWTPFVVENAIYHGMIQMEKQSVTCKSGLAVVMTPRNTIMVISCCFITEFEILFAAMLNLTTVKTSTNASLK